MPQWNTYPSLTATTPGDTVLALDVSATPPAAGTVKQATLAALAAPIGAYNILDPQFAGGADPTGTADSYAAIQACLDAANGVRPAFFPAGVYAISQCLEFDAYTPVIGAWRSGIDTFFGTTLYATASMPAMMASRGWLAGANTSTTPQACVTNLKLWGNGNAVHGIVSQNWDSLFLDVYVQDVSGDGLRFDAESESGGVTITSTGVNNRVARCTFQACGRGFATNDTVAGVYTDGWIDDCVVATATGTAGLSIRQAVGWRVTGNHVYGAVQNGIQLGSCYMTRCAQNYVETWGSSASSGTYSAYDCATYPASDSGVGSVISGNVMFGLDPGGNAGSTYCGIAFASAAGNTASVTITGNHMSLFDTGTYAAAYGIYLANGSSGSTLLAVSTGNNIQYVGADSWTAAVHQVANGGTLTVGTGN